MDLIEFDKDIDEVLEELKRNIKTHSLMIKEAKKLTEEYKVSFEKVNKLINAGNEGIKNINQQESVARTVTEKIQNDIAEIQVNVNECNLSVNNLMKKTLKLDEIIESFDTLLIEAESDLKEVSNKIICDTNTRKKEIEEFLDINKNTNLRVKQLIEENDALSNKLNKKLLELESFQNKLYNEYEKNIEKINFSIDRLDKAKLNFKKLNTINLIISIVATIIAIIAIII